MKESTDMITGRNLRAAREARRVSLSALAHRIGRDKGHLSRVERGDGREVTPALVRDYERALGVPIAASPGAGVASPPRDVAEVASCHALRMEMEAPFGQSEDLVMPARTPDGRIILVSVPRRVFLRGATAAAVSVATGAPVAKALAASSIAIGDVPASDVHPVEYFEQMRRVLADSDNLFGPSRVAPTVHEQINIIHRLRQNSRGADQQRLLRVQIQFADLLGWLHQDEADHRAAQYWLDRALEWSHIAGDPDSAVFILARKSQLAGDMCSPDEAVEVAGAAMNMAGPRSRLAAIAATYAAHGHALRGDEPACQRGYGRARELLSKMDSDSAPWGFFFVPSYVQVQRAHSLAVLGKHRSAAEGFQAAIESLPSGFHRDRGVYLAREALAYASCPDADTGDAEKAAALGLMALAVGVDTGSRRILSTLARLEDATARWRRTVPRVAEFHRAMGQGIASRPASASERVQVERQQK